MDFKNITVKAEGIKIFLVQDDKEMARATLFILENDLRRRKFGFMEDVFVDAGLRGQGIGTKLVEKIIEIARANQCYKIVATSRYEREQVHELYKRLGFKNFGIEFKMYLE